MTVEPVFEGVGVALLTLFDDDGAVDGPATGRLATRLVDLGVRGVVVAGTTGEAATLTADERVLLLESVLGAVDDRVPVIAGTGASEAGDAAELTKRALEVGAHAVLALSPPAATELAGYYGGVVDAADGRPVLAYHYPKVSPPGIPVEALRELPIDGLKDSTGDPERLLRELTEWDGPLYTGSSALLSFAGPLGCAGAILALANLDAEGCAAAFGGDVEAQRTLTPAHVAAHDAFPRRLKEMVAERFGTSVVTRV